MAIRRQKGVCYLEACMKPPTISADVETAKIVRVDPWKGSRALPPPVDLTL